VERGHAERPAAQPLRSYNLTSKKELKEADLLQLRIRLPIAGRAGLKATAGSAPDREAMLLDGSRPSGPLL